MKRGKTLNTMSFKPTPVPEKKKEEAPKPPSKKRLNTMSKGNY